MSDTEFNERVENEIYKQSDIGFTAANGYALPNWKKEQENDTEERR